MKPADQTYLKPGSIRARSEPELARGFGMVVTMICLSFVPLPSPASDAGSRPIPSAPSAGGAFGSAATPLAVVPDGHLTTNAAGHLSAEPANGPIGMQFPRATGGLDDRQKLAVGDRVSFRVLEDREEAKLLTITDAGELDVPELGLVHAAGKTCRELALEIKSKLEQTTYYQATVILGIDLLNKTLSGRKVYVAGQVRLTGPQEIPAGETWTVSKAILKAGGFTNFADKKRVRVIRGGTEGKTAQSLSVNVSEILEKGQRGRDLAVEPEDLIYVPARGVNFY